MNQRIKPVNPNEGEKYNKYIKQITLLHELLVYSMKAKQSIDLGIIDKLTVTLTAFKDSYFEDKEGKLEEHKH